MALLVEMCTLKSKKEMHKRKEMLSIRISYLICIPRQSHTALLAHWGFFVDEQRPHTPLEVVVRLPCCLAAPIGLTLLTFGSSPHSQ
jgi:hypothetical protein